MNHPTTDTSEDEIPAVTPVKAKRAGRGFMLLSAALAVGLAVGFALVSLKKQASETALANETEAAANAPPLVEVVPVEAAPPTQTLTLPGSVSAWYASTIYARVDGFVANWTADLGDHVAKGQVLAMLDTPELDARLTAAKAKVRADEGVLAQRKSEAEFAQSTFQRWADSPKGVVSEQEREAKKSANDNAIAKLHEAEAQLGLDQAEVDRYATMVNFKNVTAPYDGTITERHLDIGNLVTAGSASSTSPLYHIQQDAPVRVFVDVPQTAAGDVKSETPVEIRVGNMPNRTFLGKVTRTADAIDQKSRTLRIEVDLPNEDRALVPGMYVDVNFSVASKGLLQVPAAALVFRSGGAEVAVVNDKNQINFRKVIIAQDHGSSVELSSGVSLGEQVALNVNSEIVDGDLVEIHSAANLAVTKAPSPATR